VRLVTWLGRATTARIEATAGRCLGLLDERTPQGRFLRELGLLESITERSLTVIVYTIRGYAIYPPMAHTTREKSKLLGRIRRVRGQVEALERAIEAEQDCADVLHLIAAARGAINALMAVVLEDHIRMHVSDPRDEKDRVRARGSEDLIDAVRSYFK